MANDCWYSVEITTNCSYTKEFVCMFGELTHKTTNNVTFKFAIKLWWISCSKNVAHKPSHKEGVSEESDIKHNALLYFENKCRNCNYFLMLLTFFFFFFVIITFFWDTTHKSLCYTSTENVASRFIEVSKIRYRVDTEMERDWEQSCWPPPPIPTKWITLPLLLLLLLPPSYSYWYGS